ncbi:MAG: GyrI-like domain-containing protein [Alphaproteobacteria bacterium]|nr:GyrI-like domain-containing protein [Alphaproteobacteria bacterium]
MQQPKAIILDKSFSVTGLQARTNNMNESSSEHAKIGDLWSNFFQSPLPEYANKNNQDIYGVYSQYESDENGYFTVTAGINSESAPADSNDNHEVTVQSGTYLAFEANGKQPESIIGAWKEIWKYFQSSDAPKRKFTTDFEKYISDTKLQIYIAV